MWRDERDTDLDHGNKCVWNEKGKRILKLEKENLIEKCLFN